MRPHPAFSVVLPARNQEDHIQDVITGYLSRLRELPFRSEVVVVVNASTDRTLAVCQGLQQNEGDIQVLEEGEGGWGRAVKRGLSQAVGSLLCFTNSARTTPHDLASLAYYAHAHDGYVIKANRKIRDNWTRRLGSLLYNLECRALFDLPYWDVNGTPKIFPRSLGKLLSLSRDDDLLDLEFDAICRREGYPVVEIPILSSRRHGGQSTTNYVSAAKMYWGAIQLQHAMRTRHSS